MKIYAFLASFGREVPWEINSKRSSVRCLFSIVVGRIFCKIDVPQNILSKYGISNLRDLSSVNRGNLSNWERWNLKSHLKCKNPFHLITWSQRVFPPLSSDEPFLFLDWLALFPLLNRCAVQRSLFSGYYGINYAAESCTSCTISEILGARGAQNAGQGNRTDPGKVVMPIIFCGAMIPVSHLWGSCWSIIFPWRTINAVYMIAMIGVDQLCARRKPIRARIGHIGPICARDCAWQCTCADRPSQFLCMHVCTHT
jgi:hypothetical protein